MRTLIAALAFLVMAAMTAGHVDSRRPETPDVRVPGDMPQVAGPVSAPAGVEFLLVIR